MEQEISLSIKKAILHILDNTVQIPIMSSQEIKLEEDIFSFLENHLIKVLKSDKVKNGVFNDAGDIVYNNCIKLSSDDNALIGVSTELAEFLFAIMKKNADIPPGDVIFCVFQVEDEKYLAMMKFNYHSSYIHYVMNTDKGNVNTIIKQNTTLPGYGQKLDECMIINLSNYQIMLLEKEYEINGNKDFYLSNLFLKCCFDLSNEHKLKIISKTAKKLNKKYFDDDFIKNVKLQQMLADSFEEAEEIKIESVAKEVFGDYDEIKKEYREEIQQQGIIEATVPIQPSSNISKKLRTHKLKTDNGIEIKLPTDYYNQKDIVEFINNPDGTISILLKKITRIMNK